MESEIGVSSDELDCSLFEGMVLFSPNDLLQPSLPQEKGQPAPSAPQDPAPPFSQSKPLDEDLFSDLSLQIPVGAKDTPPVISSLETAPIALPSAPSRLNSRKKKRGFRIGYGREAFDATPPVSVDDPPLSTDYSIQAFSSNSTLPAQSLNEEMLDELRFEDVGKSETALSVTATNDGDGLPPSQRCDDSEGYAEEVPSTVAVSEEEKEDTLKLLEEKLNLLRSSVSAKLEKIRETATTVYAEKKELERRRRKAGQDLNQASALYKNLEKQLEVACEDEEYDKAERVSRSLAAAEKEKDRVLNALRERELECDHVDSRMQEVLQLQIAAEQEGIELLEQFAKDAADQADLVHRNAEEVSSKHLENWQSSMEMLEMSKFEMDIEAELVSDARLALDSSIKDLIKDDRELVEGLMQERFTLAKELDELLNLVRLKEAEIGENELRICEVEKKMSTFTSELHEASSSVGMKHDNLKSAMSMIDAKLEFLSSKKNEFDEFISLEERKCLNLKELASSALNEARTCQDLAGLRKELASSILKSREDKVQLVRTEEKIQEEIQGLRQQISRARTTLQELSSSRVSIQQDIDLIKKRIAFVDKRGPELETEKKVAAATRNFKEAGRIAAEAKALNLERESLQNEMDKAALKLENLDMDIKNYISSMQENEELVTLKEMEAAIASFKKLQLIAAAARSESLAALESGDSVEGDFLLKEAEAAEERARELQEAYSLNPKIHGNSSKCFFPVALVSKFSGFSLAEMAAALKQHVAVSDGRIG